jgi:glucan-binding YG repeat protein
VLCLAGPVRASAASTNVVTSAKVVTGGKWVGKKYRLASGKYAKNTWLKIGSGIYRFNAKGVRQTGWITYKSAKYYAASNGRIYVKKWLKKNGKYYYFLSDGKLARSRMVTTSGKTYYVNKSGVRVTSTWVTYGGKRYYFDKSGVRLQGRWLKYGKKYYYLGADGAKVVKQWVGDYYVDANGARMTDCIVDGYYLDETGKKTVQKFTGKYIFVGDSRTEGMRLVDTAGEALYIAKIGAGYEWLNGEGGTLLAQYLKLNPNVKVVLAFGVNDLGNIQLYLTYYRNLITSYPKTSFYFLSVNPVDEQKEASYGFQVKNKSIRTFNKKLLQEVGTSVYIDSYTYLTERGIDTIDGLHYEAQVYTDLYSFVTTGIG